MDMEVTTKELFEFDNQKVCLYEIKNDRGMQINILNLGGIITDIITPDRYGNYENIVLKYSSYETYIDNPSYLGAIIGRFAGRVCDGRIDLSDNVIQLSKNFNEHHGHGGEIGFNKKIWQVEYIINEDFVDMILNYTSPSGENGYPGELNVWVKYTITNNNQLIIEYKGESNKTTLVNLTNHSYFNLGGYTEDSILSHQLYLKSNSFIQLDKSMVPTGKILPVHNSPFDFTSLKEIGKDINSSHHQMLIGNGYDHPWILNTRDSQEPQISLYDSRSGRAMDVATDQKCVVVYTLNYPDEEFLSKGRKANPREGICLECQNPPIGRNQVFLEDSILEPGESYSHKTSFVFYNK